MDMINHSTAAFAASLACVLAASAAQAAAVTDPAQLCKGGHLASVRLSTIKPGGSVAAFDKAVKDHMGWYRGHGYKENRLLAGPVITGDRASGTWTASTTEFVSVHLDAPGVPPAKRDAGWDGYVKEYRDVSDLSVDKYVCLMEPVK
jgi:hypothetical protein